jgi:hypothetical protein
MPKEHPPSLGLLATGGPLLDDGHDVQMIDADRRMSPDRVYIHPRRENASCMAVINALSLKIEFEMILETIL